LLVLGGLTILLALAAIIASWDVAAARNLLLVSLVLLIGFEFLAPLILLAVLRNAQSPVEFGPLLRLLPTAFASLLAFAGIRELYRKPNSARPA
jgi:hypothetical protein